MQPTLFADADPNARDLFASGYCADSYFTFDVTSDGFSPTVYARYGERIITESFELDRDVEASTDELELDHLACRYFRLYPGTDCSQLEVKVHLPEDPDGALPLKAELIGVTRFLARGETAVAAATTEGSGTALALRLDGFCADTLGHAILVVTNCSYGEKARDGVAFSVSALAS